MKNRDFLAASVLLTGLLPPVPVMAEGSVFEDVIVVTAHRSASSQHTFRVDEVPATAADMAQAVASLPGAALVSNGSLSGQVQYRGAYGFRVGTRINGQSFRSGGPNLMDPPMHYAPPALVESVLVNRGAAPLSFGPSLVGGVEVNLKEVPFSDSAQHELAVDVTGLARSADSSHAVGALVGSASDATRLYLFYSEESGDEVDSPIGEIDNTFHDRKVYGGGFGFRHGDTAWHLSVRQQDTGATGNPPFAMDIDYVKTDIARLTVETRLGGTDVKAALGFSDVDHLMNNHRYRPAPASPMRYRETRAVAETVTLDLETSTALSRGTLGWGIDAEVGEHDVRIFNPTNPNFSVAALPDIRQERVGSYLNWTQSLGAGDVEIGLRVDRYEDKAGSAINGIDVRMMPAQLTAGFNAGARAADETTIDLLARYWQQQDFGTWRVSLARKNRAPTYLERFGWLPIPASAGLADGNTYVGDVTLEVETAWILEAGVDLTLGSLWLRPTAYYHAVDDYIQGVPFDMTPKVADSMVEQVSMMNGDPTPLRFANVNARMVGLDADFGWQLSSRVRLEGLISVVRGERRDISDDLYRISPDKLALGIVYEGSNWSVTTEAVGYRAQHRVSVTNSEAPSSGYGLLNLFARWQPVDSLVISAGVENLADREYYDHMRGYNRVLGSVVPVGERLPGSGRNVFVRVGYRNF